MPNGEACRAECANLCCLAIKICLFVSLFSPFFCCAEKSTLDCATTSSHAAVASSSTAAASASSSELGRHSVGKSNASSSSNGHNNASNSLCKYHFLLKVISTMSFYWNTRQIACQARELSLDSFQSGQEPATKAAQLPSTRQQRALLRPSC